MSSDDLADSFDELLAALAGAAEHVRDTDFYAAEQNRAGAHTFLLGLLTARLEEYVFFDPAFPGFRVLDTRIREGGDNSDQRYLISRLTGGETYRVWGTLGDAQRLEFQVYAGVPYDGTGRMASYLGQEDLMIEADGSFEVFLSAEERSGNWLENPADATRILVRQIYSDWASSSVPGEVHIDRVGGEGELRPALGAAELAERLRGAASDLAAHARIWPGLTANRYYAGPANQIREPSDPGAVGGVPGRWMASGRFELEPDEALVVTSWPWRGDYQGIQLTDPWFSSLEYGNRQTSLTAEQAQLDSDGAYRFVISAADPGVPNWLDTVGRTDGIILMRFDGAAGVPFPAEERPHAEKVKLAELASMLPADTPRVDADERWAQIAQRRRHVQQRFGH